LRYWEKDLVSVVLRNGDIKSIRIGEIIEEYDDGLSRQEGDLLYVVEVLSSYEGSDLGNHVVHESRIALVSRPEEDPMQGLLSLLSESKEV
tara:strand:- start:617 stop:889 length:273 start_codon:yes stop_codon:yes gene_type:complete